MLRLFLVSLLVVICSSGPTGLSKGPDPINEEKSPPTEKKVSRRQYAWAPGTPLYSPYILPYVIPTYQVHHVVVLQTPQQQRCIGPAQGGSLEPVIPSETPSLVENRLGGVDNRNETIQAQPSRCVWAIVACCSPGSANIRYSCFELLGCPGGFWDSSPCEVRVVQAAANTALKFYMQGGKDPNASNNNI